MDIDSLKVPPERLTSYCDPDSLGVETSSEVKPLEGTVGQDRALSALDFGLSMNAPGYNIYVAGSPGTGRTTTLTSLLHRAAKSRPTPDDWCYVHNFEQPHRPHAISLPAGRGAKFRDDMAGLVDANSSEFDRCTPHPVIDLLPEQRTIADMGGTMRLGLYPITIAEDSLAARMYGALQIEERHRHRYEVSNEYRQLLEKNGFRVSGIWPEKQLVEIIELPEHPWFVAGQFHPEFRSRPWQPHPLFAAFVRAAIEHGGR